jgi:hypothetical protein
MALSQIKVEIDGSHVANTLAVEYGLDVNHDTNGSPSDARPRLARIKITRRSDNSTTLGDWASKPFKGHFKSGKISFFAPHEETKVQSTMSWTDGYVTLYKEIVPDVNTDRAKPMIEIVEISAQKIKINDVEVDADSWTL